MYLLATLFFTYLLAASVENSRAVSISEDRLWPNGIIYYQYDSSVPSHVRRIIQEAMDVWEEAACLKFKLKAPNITDYVVFNSYPNHEYCTCDSVGRIKGQQNNIILGYSCQNVGELLHTLGHVIGLFNEQSRPDRDDYVTILAENIEDGEEERFAIINDLSVGYQGEGYDYASIMHLHAAAYGRSGLTTTEIANEQEYRAQGSPKLGERLHLSEGDIRRVNRLYSCQAVGKCEKLQVNIRGMQEVVSTAGLDHHVKVVAVDNNGSALTLSTQCIRYDDVQGAFNPTWNKILKFPVSSAKWQFFRISVLAEETLLSRIETFPLELGTHTCAHHSAVGDQSELDFSYECIADVNDCLPSPCMAANGCRDLMFDYMCQCRSGYGGKNCSIQCPRGYDGFNCEIDISGDSCSPNPCISAHSISCLDGIFDHTCNCRRGYGGKNCEQDISGNSCVPNPCVNNHTHNCVDGIFNYTCNCKRGYGGKNCQYDISGDSCSPSPCIAAHTLSCVDGFYDYTCNCRRGYGGKNCELDISGDSCSSNPCIQGHTLACIDGFYNYTCNCKRGWGGKNCEVDNSGNSCSPNPCVAAHTTRCVDGFYNYTCNCKRGWGGINCQVDSSGNSCSPNPCVAAHTTRCVDGFLDYTCKCRRGWDGKNCQVDNSGNSCSPNPCHRSNSLNCIDGFFDYTCNCRSGYSGKQCQTHKCSFGYCTSNGGTCSPYGYSPYYRCSCPLAWTPSSQCRTWESRCLQVVIKYARGLSDRDRSWFTGDSDPYTRITAYSTDGHTSSAKTHFIQGNENPNWNYVFNAGCGRAWDKFWFQVWDSDVGRDDQLSSGQYVNLTSLSWLPRCSYTVNIIGGSGSITFDIFYYTRSGAPNAPGSC